MKLQANKVHIQGVKVHVLLADKVHKQEPQRVAIYVSHMQPCIPT